jgi:hypothetical protein
MEVNAIVMFCQYCQVSASDCHVLLRVVYNIMMIMITVPGAGVGGDHH